MAPESNINPKLHLPNYEILALLYSSFSAPELFYSLTKYNKKAAECINPRNKDFYPNDLLIYLDQVSIIKDVLILNKPILELKEVKGDLEFWLNIYLDGLKTVSQETKKEMQQVTEHIKGEIEEANKYLAEAISLRR